MSLTDELSPPIRAENILPSAQWIGGVGAGAWLTIEEENESFVITRQTKDGETTFRGSFNLSSGVFDIKKPFQFTYPSHFEICTVIQNRTMIQFKNNSNN